MTDRSLITAQFDTTVVNALADRSATRKVVLDAVGQGLLRVFRTVETTNEVLKCSDPARLADLFAVLEQLPALEPTRQTRLGAARLGQGRVVLPSDEKLASDLGFLKGPTDRLLAANAGGYRCDYFVTDDKEMLKTKRERVEAVIGSKVIGIQELCELLVSRLKPEQS